MDALPNITRLQPGEKITLAPGESITAAGQSKPEYENITVTFPIFQWDSGYVRQKLDVMLTGAQAATLKSIQLGLEKQEAQLINGRYVANPVDAIRWLLECAAGGIPEI